MSVPHARAKSCVHLSAREARAEWVVVPGACACASAWGVRVRRKRVWCVRARSRLRTQSAATHAGHAIRRGAGADVSASCVECGVRGGRGVGKEEGGCWCGAVCGRVNT
eukprot:2163679-Pleurochrysis_carterae.AAC.1